MNGVKFSEPGKDLQDIQASDVVYDTSNDIVQVDFTKTPPHLQLIDPLPQATAWTVTLNSSGDKQFREEILFQIPHGLPYKPDFVCYFYCYDSPIPSEIGSYRVDYYTVGLGGEYIQADSDETYFRILHSILVAGAPPGTTYPFTQTIDAVSKRKYRIKYMILQRPSQGELSYGST